MSDQYFLLILLVSFGNETAILVHFINIFIENSQSFFLLSQVSLEIISIDEDILPFQPQCLNIFQGIEPFLFWKSPKIGRMCFFKNKFLWLTSPLASCTVAKCTAKNKVKNTFGSPFLLHHTIDRVLLFGVKSQSNFIRVGGASDRAFPSFVDGFDSMPDKLKISIFGWPDHHI